jgi:hypothetical protein
MSQFMQVDTKEIVRIVSETGNFLTLNNGTKIDKQLFSQKYAALPSSDATINPQDFMNQKTNINVNPPKNQYQPTNDGIVSPTGVIDPEDFLYSPSLKVDGLENIQKIDTSKHIDIPDEQGRVQIRDLLKDDSTIQQLVPNSLEQKKALLEKYAHQTQQGPGYVNENDPAAIDTLMKSYQQPQKQTILNENGLTEHQERMRQQHMELKNGEDPYAEKIKKYRLSKGLPPQPVANPQIVVQPQQTENFSQPQMVQQVEDPTTALFRKFKRNHNLTVSLKIKDKISKPDFIKVMADGLDGDIIQYYTDQIFNSFVSDPQKIKDDIYNQVFKNVYGCLPTEMENDDDDDDYEDENKTTLPKVDPSKVRKLNEGVDEKEKAIILIPGKPTKTGKITFKYINKGGKVVDMIPETAEKKGYKPATKKDLK